MPDSDVPVQVMHPAAMRKSDQVEAAAALQEGEAMVTMTFPRRVELTLDDHRRIVWQPGPGQVPEHLKDHWWLRNNGVKPYDDAAEKKSPEVIMIKGHSKMPDLLRVVQKGKGEIEVKPSDLAVSAFRKLGLTQAEWNQLDQADVDAAIDTELKLVTDPQPTPDKGDTGKGNGGKK